MLTQAANALLIVSWMVGAASLARLSPDWAAYGPIAEFRFLLLLPLLTLLYVCHARDAFKRSMYFGDWIWLSALLLAHLLVAASWSWGMGESTRIWELVEVLLLVVTLATGAVLITQNPAGFLELTFRLAFWVGMLITGSAVVLFGSIAGELGEIGAGGIGLSRLSALATIGGLYFWATGRGIRWLLPLPLFLGSILLSGSRAAALALALTLAALLLRGAGLRRVGSARSVQAAALLICMLLAALALTEVGHQAIALFLLQSFTGGDVNHGHIYLADRDVIFRDAWFRFSDNPLAGAGLGSYVGPFSEGYPHNLFLSFAVDGGIIPLLLALACALAPFFGWMRGATVESSFAYAAALFFLVASCLAGAYYDARWFWLFCLIGMQLARRPAGRPASTA